MISSPSDYEQLDTKGEWANLQQSHAHLTDATESKPGRARCR
jgi:hypothetical protein